jgi:transposase InsO family protein
LSVHRNAALSLRQRERLVCAVAAGMTITAAALMCGCSRQTGSKWVGRHRRGGSLRDRSSRPHRSPWRTPAAIEWQVLELRERLGKGPHPIGWQLGIAASSVHAILRRHGQSRLDAHTPEPVLRYQRQRPGELVHIDVKKLGRIKRPRNPETGLPYGSRGRAGWDYLFVCIDDRTRLAHAELYPAETTANALDFLARCQQRYRRYGIELEEVLTDNGKCFQRSWNHQLTEQGLTPRHTRVRRPQTNGKAERFIQTLLNEWVRPHTYSSNQHRTTALQHYLNYYNHQRQHRSLNGLTPAQTVNNLPGTHNQVRALALGGPKRSNPEHSEPTFRFRSFCASMHGCSQDSSAK